MGFEEKPVFQNQINAGVYVLNPDPLDTLKTGEHYDMPNLFSRLQSSNAQTIVYPIHEYWLDVGQMEGYEKGGQDDNVKGFE